MNFHKQKLYALTAAGIAFVALLLPWISVSFIGPSATWNGIRGWGILSLFGVIGVVALALLGTRTDDYTAEFKKYTLIAFGAIALGALLFFIRKNSVVGGGDYLGDIVKTGIGLWICLIAGIGGLAVTYGLIKPGNKIVTKTEV